MTQSTLPSLRKEEQFLGNLRRAARPELVQPAVRALAAPSPARNTRPGVAGGEPCIVRTRIPVWLLEQARRLGTTEAQLLGAYPTLRAEDLGNAGSYARAHRDEVDRQIRDNEEAGALARLYSKENFP